MYVIGFFVRLPVDEYLGDFRVLAIVSNASMNMDKHISPEVSIFISFGYFPQSGTAGSFGSLILNFLGAPPSFSLLDSLIYIPTNDAEGILFLVFLVMSILTGMR